MSVTKDGDTGRWMSQIRAQKKLQEALNKALELEQ